MSFFRGFIKTSSKEEGEKVDPKKAFLGGAAVGATYNVGKNVYQDYRERQVKNSPSVKHLQKQLKPGDLLFSGSHGSGSSAITVNDLDSPRLRKLLKGAGFKGNTQLYNFSNVLTALGAGGKYHAGIYMGRGRVAHMSTDEGIFTSSLKDFSSRQNVSAHRFSGPSSEKRKALNFVKKSLKAKTPYQKFHEYAVQPISNILSPVGKGTCTQVGKSMVCNTLPVRAYSKRSFGPQGEYSFSSDLRSAKGLRPVARLEKTKLPLATKALTHSGRALHGLKWGIGAGLGAMAYNKYRSIKSERGKEKAPSFGVFSKPKQLF